MPFTLTKPVSTTPSVTFSAQEVNTVSADVPAAYSLTPTTSLAALATSGNVQISFPNDNARFFSGERQVMITITSTCTSKHSLSLSFITINDSL